MLPDHRRCRRPAVIDAGRMARRHALPGKLRLPLDEHQRFAEDFMTRPVVGIVGIGAMGMGVALNLLERGYTVHVRDIRREAEEAARAAGGVPHPTPAALAAACDVVMTVVVDDAQTEDVLFGPDGIAGALAPEAVVVLDSTLSPAFVAGAAERLAARGHALVDAPISGGPARARDGSMSMMIAGAPEARTRAARVMADAAARCFVVGDRAGDGARMKLVNNALAGVNLAAAAEAMALALKLGLDGAIAHDVIQASSGASWMFGDRMPRVLSGDYAPRAAARILAKDMGLFLDTAAAAGYAAPIATAGRAAYLAAMAAGLAEEDDAAVIKPYAAVAGVKLP
jgi:3-hydroxyisobutyrate dehydrogenase